MQIEDLRRQLDKLRTISAREQSKSDDSIARLEQNLILKKQTEKEYHLAMSKALKMLQVFLQCNEGILDPVKHQDAWKLVSVYVLRRPSTDFQNAVHGVINTMKPSITPSIAPQLASKSIQRTASRPNILRRKDSSKLNNADNDQNTSVSTPISRQFIRQETRKGLLQLAGPSGLEQNIRTSGSAGQVTESQSSKNLGDVSRKEDNVSTALYLDNRKGDQGSDTSGMTRLPSTSKPLQSVTSSSDLDNRHSDARVKQDQYDPTSRVYNVKDEDLENSKIVKSPSKMKIKIPMLRLDGRISPKSMLRNVEVDGQGKVLKDESQPPVAFNRRSEDLRSNSSFRMKNPSLLSIDPNQKANARVSEPPALQEAYPELKNQVSIQLDNEKSSAYDFAPVANLEGISESPPVTNLVLHGSKVENANTKPADVFDSILEAESFIKSAEMASVAFSSNTDLLEFNDAEFDLGKVERMMNMHKMRVSRSRDEQLKLLDALSSEFQGLD